MIDRLVHHAEILSLKGDSYRLRGKDVGADRARSARDLAPGWDTFRPPKVGHFSAAVDMGAHSACGCPCMFLEIQDAPDQSEAKTCSNACSSWGGTRRQPAMLGVSERA